MIFRDRYSGCAHQQLKTLRTATLLVAAVLAVVTATAPISTTPCTPNPCLHGGTCSTYNVSNKTTFKCTCSNLWSGTWCQNDVNVCINDAITCSNHGVCHNTSVNHSHCDCHYGFRGPDCSLSFCTSGLPSTDCVITNASGLTASFPCTPTSTANGPSKVCTYNGTGGLTVANLDYDFGSTAEVRIVANGNAVSFVNVTLTASWFNVSASDISLHSSILNTTARGTYVNSSSTATGAGNIGAGGRSDQKCFNSPSAAPPQNSVKMNLPSVAIDCRAFPGVGRNSLVPGGGCIALSASSQLAITASSQLLSDGAAASTVYGGGSGGSIFAFGSVLEVETSTVFSASGGAALAASSQPLGGGGGGLVTFGQTEGANAVTAPLGESWTNCTAVTTAGGGGLSASTSSLENLGCLCGGAGLISVCNATSGECSLLISNSAVKSNGFCTAVSANTPAVRCAATPVTIGAGALSLNISDGAILSTAEIALSTTSAAPFVSFENAIATATSLGAATVAPLTIISPGGSVIASESSFLGTGSSDIGLNITAVSTTVSGSSVDAAAVLVGQQQDGQEFVFSVDDRSVFSLRQCINVVHGTEISLHSNTSFVSSTTTASAAWCGLGDNAVAGVRGVLLNSALPNSAVIMAPQNLTTPQLVINAGSVSIGGQIEITGYVGSEICGESVSPVENCSHINVSQLSSQFGASVMAHTASVNVEQFATLAAGSIAMCANTSVAVAGSVSTNSGGCSSESGFGKGVLGSGAGHGGRGGDGAGGAAGGLTYGDAFSPHYAGSGGGGGVLRGDGGSGGGVVSIGVSNGVLSMTATGSIDAGGESVDIAGGGSGGSITVFANDVTGSGTITADGGSSSNVEAGSGGGGYVAFSWLPAGLNRGENWTGTAAANGGQGAASHGHDGNVTGRNCAMGTYSEWCTVCPPGQYRDSTESSVTGCNACKAGQFQELSGQSTCLKCYGGEYAASVGSTACDVCGVGKYSAQQSGSTSCASCSNKPQTHSTYYKTNQSSSQCAYKCDKEYAGVSCTICSYNPETNAVCNDVGTCIGGSAQDPYVVGCENRSVGCGNCTCPSVGYVGSYCATYLEQFIESLGGPLALTLLAALLVAMSVTGILCCRIKSCPGYLRRNKHTDPLLERQASHLALVKVKTLGQSFLNNDMDPSMQGSAGSKKVERFLCRLYCAGSNVPHSQLQLDCTVDNAMARIVRRDDFEKFAHDFNTLASFSLQETSLHCLLRTLSPLGELYVTHIRKRKIGELMDFVQNYDHKCFRSARAQHIKSSLHAHHSKDLSMFYIDVVDVESTTKFEYCRRGPLLLPFAGEGTYFSPFFLDPNDILVKYVPEVATNMGAEKFIDTQWCQFVQDLNVSLRVLELCATTLRKNLSAKAVLQFMQSFQNMCATKDHLGGVVVRLVILRSSSFFGPAAKQYLSNHDHFQKDTLDSVTFFDNDRLGIEIRWPQATRSSMEAPNVLQQRKQPGNALPTLVVDGDSTDSDDEEEAQKYAPKRSIRDQDLFGGRTQTSTSVRIRFVFVYVGLHVMCVRMCCHSLDLCGDR